MSTAKGKVTGNTIRNIVEMRLTVTGEQRISLEATPGSNPAAVTAPALALETARGAELEQAIVPGVALELQTVPAAEELEHAPAAELALVQAVAVLEPDQVAVVLVRDHLRARLAEALRTKSVTAAHPHDLVPLLEAGEDLAAAAVETTREPAAAEAATAWAAAE